MFKKTLNFFIAMFKGHFTVLKNAFRKRVTLEYPEVKKPVNQRFRGKLAFNYDEQGNFPCNGCGICQRVCPCKDLIKIERSKDESGKVNIDKFEVDIAHCIFCSNCVQNCPTNALKMTKDYELAALDKSELLLVHRGK